MNTNDKGDIAEWKAVIRAREKGWLVSKPLCDSARYDLIFDDHVRLWRAQVKWANGRRTHTTGAVVVQLTRHNGVGCKGRVYEITEVDVLVVYLPKTEQLYWVPTSVFAGKGVLYLRLEPPRNKQVKRIFTASSFVW